ncbi:MAG: hypothetical protein KF884_05490 [Fimbriimonadaceae bacterium]|nr:hypothetical protein [Fimbriimonadaceae bacterium]QYK59538.1 MAG: hypothetical protein KF884_05490 [Fimbriimonadaceae bacterium]
MRRVAVIGAGNLRCMPPVLAVLAVWRPTGQAEFRLYDANEERLDLFDRFFRACLEETDNDAPVRATTELSEALEEATEVIVALNEDGAWRMLGLTSVKEFEERVDEDEVFIPHGDPNRPTPLDRLSPRTRAILSSPTDIGRDREAVIGEALSRVAQLAPRRARVVSLVRGVLMPEGFEHDSLLWPQPLSSDQAARVPHQVLRWILGEQTLRDLLSEAARSPLAAWLEGS